MLGRRQRGKDSWGRGCWKAMCILLLSVSVPLVRCVPHRYPEWRQTACVSLLLPVSSEGRTVVLSSPLLMQGTLKSSSLLSSGRTGLSSYTVSLRARERADLLLSSSWITCAKAHPSAAQPVLHWTDRLSYRERHLVATTYHRLQKIEQNRKTSRAVLSTS